ncbi:hypothetical protein [Mesorhizobium xinjiangense]|uniref:hypothetical protein n=1 Tax=Mesorhizobium xinjiangense TaxID=2678685 RepID=UPI0012ED22E3|nr:hypothetical protein [Mesorhizobium xinjiangense]
MDQWLVTFPATMSLDACLTIVRQAGAEELAQSEAVPLGGDEIVIQIEAGPNAVEALRASEHVLGVFPNSEMKLY